jgi:hypothetical protein
LVTGVKHEIDVVDAKLYRCNPRPTTSKKRKILDEEIDKALRLGDIEPCLEPPEWGYCPVLVEKKRQKRDCLPNWRMCIDYRPVEARTRVASYPMPRIDCVLAQLGRAKIFTTVDLSSDYNQIYMKSEHRNIPSFITPHLGSYRFRRMPFALAGSGFTFQRVMDRVMQGAAMNYCAAFLDDIVIYSDLIEEHVRQLDDVFSRLSNAGITVNPNKINIVCKEVKVLGHIVLPGGFRPDTDKIVAIKKYRTPTEPVHIQRFLGAVGFFRWYIDGFSISAAPLYKLLK